MTLPDPRVTVAIDQGTTSTRALRLEADGTARIVARRRHRQIIPRPGWLEHDPAELLADLRACLEAVPTACRVGLANQGESCLAWDALTGAPLSPVIVWQDRRTAGTVEALRAAGGEAETRTCAGLPLDPYFSAAKLGWLLRELPEVAAAHARGRLRLGTTDAFFRQHLTGRCATDAATASRTSLLALSRGSWDARLCALFGVPIETLPEIGDSQGALGEIGDAVLGASLVDQQAALFGHGCDAPGRIKITFGTGAFALGFAGPRPPLVFAAGPLPTIAWRRGGVDSFALEGGVLQAGSAVERGLVFVPALSGLGCPHWDATAGGLWIGLGVEQGPGDLCQAVLEGIALRCAELVAALETRLPRPETISVDGGLAGCDPFLQFLADALQRELFRPDFRELTALGCARLAAGAGRAPPPPSGRRFSPRGAVGPDRAAAWRARFAAAVARSRGWREGEDNPGPPA